jgi:nitrogen fixation NifU-like protein
MIDEKRDTEVEGGRFSNAVLEEFHSPYGMETIFDPDGYSKVTGGCGDTFEVFLRLREDGTIHMAFRTDGCIPTVACGSMLSRIVRGRTVPEAEKTTEEELISALGGLPSDHLHCATLAVDVLFKAILDMQTRSAKE